MRSDDSQLASRHQGEEDRGEAERFKQLRDRLLSEESARAYFRALNGIVPEPNADEIADVRFGLVTVWKLATGHSDFSLDSSQPQQQPAACKRCMGTGEAEDGDPTGALCCHDCNGTGKKQQRQQHGEVEEDALGDGWRRCVAVAFLERAPTDRREILSKLGYKVFPVALSSAPEWGPLLRQVNEDGRVAELAAALDVPTQPDQHHVPTKGQEGQAK